ncbi:putative ATP-dependent RNA helicase SoYb [Drosophila takahashii]|uniref:putative ATP-dependent RNA helicase SoYb n=1 Tax=Drosophila takahashii TaxID=29030 RepID=UPI001CF8E4D1|nr:putative ATP-dependent RNA helicase SoYb [Drosophila takahashii]
MEPQQEGKSLAVSSLEAKHISSKNMEPLNGMLRTVAKRSPLTHPAIQHQKLDALLQNRNPYIIPETGKVLSKIHSISDNSVQTALVIGSKIHDKLKLLDINNEPETSFIGSENVSYCFSELKLSNKQISEQQHHGSLVLKDSESLSITDHLHPLSSLNTTICTDKPVISKPSKAFSLVSSNENATDQLNTRSVTFSMDKLDQIFNDMLGKASVGSLMSRSGNYKSNSSSSASTRDFGKKAESSENIPINKLKESPTHSVLAHSPEPVNPVSSYRELHLCKEIQMSMKDLNFHSPLPTQMYSWPHLEQGGSLVLVNGSGTGRSWSYLPVVCSSVMRSLQNTATTLEDRMAPGPLALLVVDSVENAMNLTSHCDFLMRDYNTEFPKVVNTHDHSTTVVYMMLLNSCGVLVTTLAHLLDILVNGLALVDATRLKFLIFDDFDRMRLGNLQLLDEVLQKVYALGCLTMQLVLVAQQWHADSFKKLLRRTIKPLVLFGDFFEAALYGGLKMKIILRISTLKNRQLLDILAAQEVPRKRTLIYCKSQMELENLKMILTEAGHQCVGISRAHNQEPHELMLVSDNPIPKQLHLRNIELLIHFSLPESWLRFSSRFHTMAGNICNLFTTPPGIERPSLITYLMLDERNSREWPRTMKFLQDHGIATNELNSQFMSLSQQKMDDDIPYCPYQLSSGDCNRRLCNKRHHYVKSDLSQPGNPLQQTGTLIRCKLYKAYDPVHMAVWPLKYKSKDSCSWMEVPYPSNPSTLLLKISMGVPQKVHYPYNLNDVCFVLYEETWRRVRIVDISSEHKLTVQFMDHGSELVQVKPSDLRQCPEKFRSLPPLAMDIRLSGLVPAGEGGKWSADANQWVQESFGAVDGQVMQISVDFSILHVVYVREVSLIEECPTMLTSVYKIFLRKELLRRGFAKMDSTSNQEVRVLLEQQKQKIEELESNKENISFGKRNTDLEDHTIDLNFPRRECTEMVEKGDLMMGSLNRIQETEKAGDKKELPSDQIEDKIYEVTKKNTCKDKILNDGGKSVAEKLIPIEPPIDSSTALLNTLINELNSTCSSKKQDTQKFIHNLVQSEDNQEILHRNSGLIKSRLDKSLKVGLQELSKELVLQSLNCASKSGEVVRPRIRWHQTQTHIELIIEQQVTEYKLILKGNTLIYNVTTTTPSQRCILNLLGEVRIETEKQHGYNLHVKLAKIGLLGFWPSLLNSLYDQQNSHWLIYDTERAQGPPLSMGLALWDGYLTYENRNNYSDSEEDEFYSAPEVFREPGVEYCDLDSTLYEDF